MIRSLVLAAIASALAFMPAAAQNAEVIGIPRAIAVAEALVKGHAVGAELDYAKGRLVYEVAAVDSERLHEVVIDATTGEIVAERPRRLEGFLRSLFQADRLNAVRAAPHPLSQTLSRIEADTRQRIREVSLERVRGQTFYEVELADAGRKMLVDPRTGAVHEGGRDD